MEKHKVALESPAHERKQKRLKWELFLGLLMGWVEMSFIGWVLKWGVFGWVKMGCIS